MEITPRDYQEDGVTMVRNSLRKHKRTIMCLPTAGGKTVIFSMMTDAAARKGYNVTILVHRIELVNQTFNMLLNFGITANLITSGSAPRLDQVNVGMVETFWRRYGQNLKSSEIDLLIIDECHIGNFRKVIDPFPGWVVGVSASPIASSKSDPLNSYFSDIVIPAQTPDLIRRGFLAKGKTFSIEHDFSKLKSRAGEFTEASLFKEFKKPKLFKGALEHYEEHLKHKKTMVFNVNVEHSKLTLSEFLNAGYTSQHVDGKTPKDERDSIISAFKRDQFETLHNVGITVAGYDDDGIMGIIQNFATESLAKQVQTLGRGGRIRWWEDPFGERRKTKDEFIIIDLGKNYLRHGIYGQRIDWEGIFHNPALATNKEENQKLIDCGNCGAINKITLTKCPWCGEEKTVELINRQLRMMERPKTLAEIKQEKLDRLPQHLRKRIRDMTAQEIYQYAKIMGHDPRWARILLAKRNRR